MFSLFKKQPLFSQEENESIVSAIRSCEKRTSGEIRVFIEGRNKYMEPLDRAAEIFHALKMNLTDHRNGVLLYIAHKDHEVALFGDSGIHEKVGSAYWNEEVKIMINYFKKGKLAEGIANCVKHVGETLAEKFPYIATEDKNELPDEIIFGK
jgi:uncharacterized membrane protein